MKLSSKKQISKTRDLLAKEMSWLLLKILGGLTDVAYELLIEVFASRLDRKLPSFVSKNFFKRGKLAYKKNLIAIANVMPFLYKDLKVEVLNDFANIEIERITIDKMKFEERVYFKNSLGEMLKDSKKVMFFGNAGMGKTTFQKHSILKILTGKKDADFLYPKENPLPFYIPLKAVDDSKRFPILNYILNNRALFSETRKIALKQLLRIIKKQGIFLFIDGYDEIQFLGGNANFVRSELNSLFELKHFTPITKIPKEPTEQDFYDSMLSCRVWVSSRKEFYKLYPLHLEAGFETKGTKVMAVAIKGLYENRFQLIQNIFDKYPNHKHLLSAKYFLNELDNVDDKGMIDLSYNPLFLTIMCFVYVRKVIDKEDYKVKSTKNYYDLITECIDLLLIDLDKQKAIGVTEPEREAELNLRNAYVLEKKEFLPYFAVELFFDSKPVFDMEYLNNKVELFFEIYPEFESKEEIIRKLRKNPRNKTNFSLQLILQGLFVLIDKQNNIDLYDFPHKRFREVLATQYFEKYGYESLIKNVEKENLSELWIVIFQISQNREDLFTALLNCSKNTNNPEYISKLILNCIKQVPPTFPGSKILKKFIIECIESNTSFNLPSELLEICEFQFDETFSDYVHKKFYESLEKNELFSMSICCYFISKYNNALMNELIIKVLHPLLEEKNESVIKIILTYPKIAQFISNKLQNSSFTRHLIYIAGISTNLLLNLKERDLFREGKNFSACYIITDEIIKTALDRKSSPLTQLQLEATDKFFGKIRGEIFFDVSFLDEMPQFLKAKKVREKLLENARLDYRVYEDVMKKILSFNKQLAQQMKIFKD